jgi:hypothetical protein
VKGRRGGSVPLKLGLLLVLVLREGQLRAQEPLIPFLALPPPGRALALALPVKPQATARPLPPRAARAAATAKSRLNRSNRGSALAARCCCIAAVS